MNFQDLLLKIKKIDESPLAVPMEPVDSPSDIEDMEECGDDGMKPSGSPTSVMPSNDDDILTGECGGMMDMPGANKQPDSVTMNVSMNGSGAGGIKDLLDILRNIENAGGQDSDDVLVGIGAEEEFDNSPKPTQVPTPDSGDDLHREKDEYKKANGGGNPMRMHETLVAKLAAKYESIKGN
jgi:hypothetical protein